MLIYQTRKTSKKFCSSIFHFKKVTLLEQQQQQQLQQPKQQQQQQQSQHIFQHITNLYSYIVTDWHIMIVSVSGISYKRSTVLDPVLAWNLNR